MFFTRQQALELEVLLNPDVEKAILKMLEYADNHAKVVLDDTKVTIEELKLYQGKYLAFKELKNYRERLNSAVKNG